MSKVLTVFGAGLAGLIAARMLSERNPVIMEAQSSLPNNHHAVLRFKSGVVGDVTNIPFKKVQVSKWVLRDAGSNPIRDAAVYSRKVTGKLHARSIQDTRPVERYIAPSDLVRRLAHTARIAYDVTFESWSHNLARAHGPVISTVPIPIMMDLFKWDDKPGFNSMPGWTLKAIIKPELDCQLYGTVYSAVERDLWYRASMTGNELMIEGAGIPLSPERYDEVLSAGLKVFGLCRDDLSESHQHVSKYQKIADLNGPERESVKRFMMWLSDEHQIYSLGRFATWRPKLLLDDLVNDVRVIARLMDGESHYNQTLNK